MLLFFLSFGFAIPLHEALEIAQRESPIIQIQEYRLAQAELIWPQTLSLVSPKIFLKGNYTRNQQEIAFSTSEFLTDLPDFIDIPETEPTIIQPLNSHM